jgi:hypothetical protein
MFYIFSHCFFYLSSFFRFFDFYLQLGVIHEYSAGTDREKTDRAKIIFENKKANPSGLAFAD